MNISFAKWFYENDTYYVFSNFLEAYNDEELSIYKETINDEIHYRVKQFAQIIKSFVKSSDGFKTPDVEKIKNFVSYESISELSKKLDITDDDVAKQLQYASNKFLKDYNEIQPMNYFYAIKQATKTTDPSHVAGSITQKIKSDPYIALKTPFGKDIQFRYASKQAIDKPSEEQIPQNIQFPPNPKNLDVFTTGGKTFKFTNNQWSVITPTKRFGQTELLNLFNQGIMNTSMAKAILYYVGTPKLEKNDVVNDFKGKFKYIGKNISKKEKENVDSIDVKKDSKKLTIKDPYASIPGMIDQEPDFKQEIENFSDMLDSFYKNLDTFVSSSSVGIIRNDPKVLQIYKKFTEKFIERINSYLNPSSSQKYLIDTNWIDTLKSHIKAEMPNIEDRDIRTIKDAYVHKLEEFSDKYGIKYILDNLSNLTKLKFKQLGIEQ